eukprot:SAG31_NODE_529_length_14420_cov_20.000140_9_plen_93_part_00
MQSNEVAQRVLASGVSARRHIGTQGIAEQMLFSPSQEHVMLREMVRKFAEEQVDPQALAYDKAEEFNLPLFQEVRWPGLYTANLGHRLPYNF